MPERTPTNRYSMYTYFRPDVAEKIAKAIIDRSSQSSVSGGSRFRMILHRCEATRCRTSKVHLTIARIAATLNLTNCDKYIRCGVQQPQCMIGCALFRRKVALVPSWREIRPPRFSLHKLIQREHIGRYRSNISKSRYWLTRIG